MVSTPSRTGNLPARPDEGPSPAPAPRPPRRNLLIAAVVVLALLVAVIGSLFISRRDAAAPPGSVSFAPSATQAPPQSTEDGLSYQGPVVAFDLPPGWHEFYLSTSLRFFASYGPVNGGDDDYVLVAPVPAGAANLTRDQILAQLVPPAERSGPVETIDVNGMRGYAVATETTDHLVMQGTLVEGHRGDYLIACQYGPHMRDQMVGGCASLEDTLVEVTPPAITDASGCTDAELALLRSVPMPAGTEPGQPKIVTSGDQRECDLQVLPSQPDGYRGDLVAYFTSRLKDAGWNIEMAKVVEPGATQKWRVLADRDWDYYLVEIYVDAEGTVYAKGAVQMFFVTAVDG